MPNRTSKTSVGQGHGAERTPPPGRDASSLPAPATPFDVWLERGLHQLFDTIAQEPVPDALLKIIDQDRTKD